MQARELIYTSEGTFIKIPEAEYNPQGWALPASVREIFKKPLMISSEKIELNDAGGYIPENLNNYGFAIHPSAIVCAATLYSDENDSTKMPDGRPPAIRENVILCEGVELCGAQHIERDVFIGRDSYVDEQASIGRNTFIGADNYVGSTSAGDYKIGAFSIVGTGNRLEHEVLLASGVVIGSGNKIKDYANIGRGTVVHDKCDIESRVIVPADYVIKSNSRVAAQQSLIITNKSADRGRD